MSSEEQNYKVQDEESVKMSSNIESANLNLQTIKLDTLRSLSSDSLFSPSNDFENLDIESDEGETFLRKPSKRSHDSVTLSLNENQLITSGCKKRKLYTPRHRNISQEETRRDNYRVKKSQNQIPSKEKEYNEGDDNFQRFVGEFRSELVGSLVNLVDSLVRDLKVKYRRHNSPNRISDCNVYERYQYSSVNESTNKTLRKFNHSKYLPHNNRSKIDIDDSRLLNPKNHSPYANKGSYQKNNIFNFETSPGVNHEIIDDQNSDYKIQRKDEKTFQVEPLSLVLPFKRYDNNYEKNPCISSEEDIKIQSPNENLEILSKHYSDNITLPTTVAIANPSLHESRITPSQFEENYQLEDYNQEVISQPRPFLPSDCLRASKISYKTYDSHHSDEEIQSTCLHKAHLRKAKLMFFWVRYPSSAVLKMYFPDIKFNKNNTAQLVKWFSNFREFYYKNIEAYARRSVMRADGEDFTIGRDSDLLRAFNVHYNFSNAIEVPPNFRYVVEQTLREFFRAIQGGKDSEQSWKKSIYKVISRLDDPVPEYFKTAEFLEKLK